MDYKIFNICLFDGGGLTLDKNNTYNFYKQLEIKCENFKKFKKNKSIFDIYYFYFLQYRIIYKDNKFYELYLYGKNNNLYNIKLQELKKYLNIDNYKLVIGCGNPFGDNNNISNEERLKDIDDNLVHEVEFYDFTNKINIKKFIKSFDKDTIFISKGGNDYKYLQNILNNPKEWQNYSHNNLDNIPYISNKINKIYKEALKNRTHWGYNELFVLFNILNIDYKDNKTILQYLMLCIVKNYKKKLELCNN